MKHISRVLILLLAVTCIGCRPAGDRLAGSAAAPTSTLSGEQATPRDASAATAPAPTTTVGTIPGGTVTDPEPGTTPTTVPVSTTSAPTTVPSTASHIDTDDLDETLAELEDLLAEISNELAGVSAALNKGE